MRGGRVARVDGVRAEYADGWALARVSVTEPVLTFRFEDTAGTARSIAQRFLAPRPETLVSVLEHIDRARAEGS